MMMKLLVINILIMREIKFRGLRTDSKGWVYGYFYTINVPMGDLAYIRGIYNDEYSVSWGTVGQYTGLKDKNGIEIYEGDVLKISGYNMKVKFSKGCFYAVNEKGNTYVTFHDSIVELIGNIQEN